jgi:hypothetical protein
MIDKASSHAPPTCLDKPNGPSPHALESARAAAQLSAESPAFSKLHTLCRSPIPSLLTDDRVPRDLLSKYVNRYYGQAHQVL